MAGKDKQRQGTPRERTTDTPESEHRAPAGRGGAAMGRTVGLPFGGARPRKRKSNDKRDGTKPK